MLLFGRENVSAHRRILTAQLPSLHLVSLAPSTQLFKTETYQIQQIQMDIFLRV
jgi:uncharacterized protein Veg